MVYRYPFILLIVLALSACSGEVVKFHVGDIEGDFCGVHLNYQYCKCAFNEDFCEQIAMNKTEAKQYVDEEYDKWVEKERLNFSSKCKSDNGIYDNDECRYCRDDQSAIDGKCEKVNETGENMNTNDSAEGECRYDADCAASCVNNIKWEAICDTGKKICKNTFDTDCNTNLETFGNFSFSMICSAGECSRDSIAIRSKRNELEVEKKGYIDSLKKIDIQQDNLTAIILDSNGNCSADLLTITDESITDFATRVALLMTDSSVDYVDDAMSKLSAYVDGVSPRTDKFEVDEYKKLNCDLFDYFELELENSEINLVEINSNIDSVEGLLDSLPVL